MRSTPRCSGRSRKCLSGTADCTRSCTCIQVHPICIHFHTLCRCVEVNTAMSSDFISPRFVTHTHTPHHTHGHTLTRSYIHYIHTLTHTHTHNTASGGYQEGGSQFLWKDLVGEGPESVGRFHDVVGLIVVNAAAAGATDDCAVAGHGLSDDRLITQILSTYRNPPRVGVSIERDRYAIDGMHSIGQTHDDDDDDHDDDD
eukprot:GHVU01097957.1.p1 GENE.GHVU01097957.1~~GHVU01097957.1.p1  ORF type:complete len:200 (-),score=12.79 GHVU01097957.1:1-600(-)